MGMEWLIECFPKYKIIAEFDNIDEKGNIEVHGIAKQENAVCKFCGNPFKKWKKNDVAHAVSECLGNKRLITYCECYECNHLFGEISENHLGKYMMPYRIINEVYGKGKAKNTVKDMPTTEGISYGTYRFEQKKNVSIFERKTFDIRNLLIEKNGTGRLIKTDNGGYLLSIPRQKYQPEMVYASLMKIAYTLLPFSELDDYIKGIMLLYLGLSGKALFDESGNEIVKSLTEEERKKYVEGLPNIGWEIIICNSVNKKEINVCLLKKEEETGSEPNLLFAFQMGWHILVIPILSDNYVSGENCKFNILQKDYMMVRGLDFRKIEDEYVMGFNATEIEIPKELYDELASDLRKSNLLLRPSD